jgi:hypothetical protein
LISDDLLQESDGEIRANRRVTIRKLHDIILVVSKTIIHEAMTEKFGYRELCARWVANILTDDHKTKRMCSALKFLTRLAKEGDESLDSIVTGYKIWGFQHTLVSKQQSLQWSHMQEEVTTWFKGQAADYYGSGYSGWFQVLINVWTMQETMLKNKVTYRQFIHSVAFVN